MKTQTQEELDLAVEAFVVETDNNFDLLERIDVEISRIKSTLEESEKYGSQSNSIFAKAVANLGVAEELKLLKEASKSSDARMI